MAAARRTVTLVAILLISSLSPVAGTGAGMRLSLNPIRRVVTMLQMMQKKVEDEGKKDQQLYDKFMCYCKTGVGDLVNSIKSAEAKVVQLESSIEETDSLVKQLVSDTKKAKDDREEAKGTLKKA